MTNLRNLLMCNVSSERADASFGALFSYGMGILVLVVGFYRIASMDGTENEVFLSVLGVLILSLLMIAMGQLMEMNQRLREVSESKPKPEPGS